MEQTTKQKLAAMQRILVQNHPEWPQGKADWVARRMLMLG